MAQGGIDIELDVGDEVRDMTAHLQGLKVNIAKAVERALRKAGRWLQTHSLREISQALKIPQKSLRRRFRVSLVKRGDRVVLNVWVGLLALGAHEAGKASQNAAGVKVRGRQFDGAFLQTIYGSEEKVYIRASRNRQMGHATQGGRDSHIYRPKSNFVLAQYGDRFPVQVVGVDVESVARPILERYESRLNNRFKELLDQELNYALNYE